jgi:hypothetical protein
MTAGRAASTAAPGLQQTSFRSRAKPSGLAREKRGRDLSHKNPPRDVGYRADFHSPSGQIKTGMESAPLKTKGAAPRPKIPTRKTGAWGIH